MPSQFLRNVCNRIRHFSEWELTQISEQSLSMVLSWKELYMRKTRSRACAQSLEDNQICTSHIHSFGTFFCVCFALVCAWMKLDIPTSVKTWRQKQKNGGRDLIRTDHFNKHCPVKRKVPLRSLFHQIKDWLCPKQHLVNQRTIRGVLRSVAKCPSHEGYCPHFVMFVDTHFEIRWMACSLLKQAY